MLVTKRSHSIILSKIFLVICLLMFSTQVIAGVSPPTFSKRFSPDTIIVGRVSTLTFTINNPEPFAAGNLNFTDNLPANVVIDPLTFTVVTCVGGTLSAISGTSTISYTGGTVPASSSCIISMFVTSDTPGVYVNTTGDLTSDNGNSGTATDTLTVIPPPPPTFSKEFVPDVMVAGEVSTLTFSLNNTVSPIGATAVDFTDNLPANLVVATPDNVTSNCIGGTITAVTGTGVISYTGGSIPADALCTISVDITSDMAGVYVNTTGDLTSSLGNSGTATDTLTVNAPPPPTFSKAFAPATITALLEASTLTFTIDNTASLFDATGLDFTDNLPAGLRVASPANPGTTCTGGTLTAVSVSSVISYSGGTVSAGATCTVFADVVTIPQADGVYVNNTDDLTSSLGNSGTALATLVVTPLPESVPVPTLGYWSLLALITLMIMMTLYLRSRSIKNL